MHTPGELKQLVEALAELSYAADAFAADQGGATDSRCGLVQPVTVAECEALNKALAKANVILTKVSSTSEQDG